MAAPSLDAEGGQRGHGHGRSRGAARVREQQGCGAHGVNYDLTARLLPALGRSLAANFNVFDVMHHGTHEKQLSNVFRWLLDVGGTHNFGALGQLLFIELINLTTASPTLPAGPYTVRQEVNTAGDGEGGDIADIVLECDTAVVVIENFETSDGHGHGYDRYLQFSQRAGRMGAVVLLCVTEDRALLRGNWKQASVVTYESFVERLVNELGRDSTYEKQNPDQYAFISQLYRRYAKGKGRMSDRDVINFVTAMCVTGEAKRYREQNQEVAAERFASDLAQQARESFGEGREALHRLKARLLAYGKGVLVEQLNASIGAEFIRKVTAQYSGIYQWTINFETGEEPRALGEANLQVKFGPSAWFANEQDPAWKRKIDPAVADYSCLFITRAKNLEIRQSAVALDEVLGGLLPDDTRMHDELVALIRSS